MDEVAGPQHFCVLEAPVPTLVPLGFLGLNFAITVDEISQRHLLCPSKDVFCGRSHYLLPVLLLSI